MKGWHRFVKQLGPWALSFSVAAIVFGFSHLALKDGGHAQRAADLVGAGCWVAAWVCSWSRW